MPFIIPLIMRSSLFLTFLFMVSLVMSFICSSFLWGKTYTSKSILLCRKGDGVRRVQVLKLTPDTCQTIYTKQGKTRIKNESEIDSVCVSSLAQVEKEWGSEGWACRSIDGTEFSIRL